ncbi:hypothetical protein EBT16_12130 [bacterium]|nr:hypothetical protein [bacterium]
MVIVLLVPLIAPELILVVANSVPVVIPIVAWTVAVVIFVDTTFGSVLVVLLKFAALIKPVTSNVADVIPVEAIAEVKFNVPILNAVATIFVPVMFVAATAPEDTFVETKFVVVMFDNEKYVTSFVVASYPNKLACVIFLTGFTYNALLVPEFNAFPLAFKIIELEC